MWLIWGIRGKLKNRKRCQDGKNEIKFRDSKEKLTHEIRNGEMIWQNKTLWACISLPMEMVRLALLVSFPAGSVRSGLSTTCRRKKWNYASSEDLIPRFLTNPVSGTGEQECHTGCHFSTGWEGSLEIISKGNVSHEIYSLFLMGKDFPRGLTWKLWVGEIVIDLTYDMKGYNISVSAAATPHHFFLVDIPIRRYWVWWIKISKEKNLISPLFAQLTSPSHHNCIKQWLKKSVLSVIGTGQNALRMTKNLSHLKLYISGWVMYLRTFLCAQKLSL
jgi:hypothetical protein